MALVDGDRWSWVARIAPDVAWIEPGLAIGCRPFAAQRAAIRALGIETVISLHDAYPDEARDWETLGVEWLAFPTRDTVEIPLGRFTEIVQAVLQRRRAGRSILLHCLAGINRAPTLAAAVLCQRDNLTVDEALTRIRAVRPSASPTPEQLASLRAWASRRPDRAD